MMTSEVELLKISPDVFDDVPFHLPAFEIKQTSLN